MLYEKDPLCPDCHVPLEYDAGDSLSVVEDRMQCHSCRERFIWSASGELRRVPIPRAPFAARLRLLRRKIRKWRKCAWRTSRKPLPT